MSFYENAEQKCEGLEDGAIIRLASTKLTTSKYKGREFEAPGQFQEYIVRKINGSIEFWLVDSPLKFRKNDFDDLPDDAEAIVTVVSNSPIPPYLKAYI